jgi:hypothetical protein
MGSCHTREVELEEGITICACITSISIGKKSLTIHLYSDSVW